MFALEKYFEGNSILKDTSKIYPPGMGKYPLKQRRGKAPPPIYCTFTSSGGGYILEICVSIEILIKRFFQGRIIAVVLLPTPHNSSNGISIEISVGILVGVSQGYLGGMPPGGNLCCRTLQVPPLAVSLSTPQ